MMNGTDDRAVPPLLSTDQESCFDARGNRIPCAGSGQDGVAGPAGLETVPRFLVRGDAVHDRWTDLHWCRNANPFEFPYAWTEAFDLVEEMNRTGFNGREDWRVPSRQALFSLVSHQHINPALPSGHPFSDVFPGYYWTDNTCARLPNQAWYVHLGGARVYRGMKSGAYLVWPVAGPRRKSPPPEDRFRPDSRLVADRLTGLWWTCANPAGARCMTWEAALDLPVALNAETFGGRADWRLPNIRELESLVDLACHSPALPAGHPFEVRHDGYWSSTTSVYEPRYAWVLYLQDGAVGVGFKPKATFSAWCVSSGREGRPAAKAGR
jgi:hypothetical protein